MGDHDYLLTNAVPEAATRFGALSALFDAATRRHLLARGLGPGCRCWEAGAGGPTLIRWMAEQVGATGSVLATDLDPVWASAAMAPNLTVSRHDLATEASPAGPFDLIHARLVLTHVPARDAVIAAMVAVLAPGGWLVIEDADPALQPLACLDPDQPGAALANGLRMGCRALLLARGAELALGRTLPRRFRDAGLQQVGAEAAFALAHPMAVQLEIATIEMLQGQLVEKGHATIEEINTHLATLARGELEIVLSPMVSCWGNKV
ncbi:MAG: methyltransferase domain-containing protein [bacterium]